MKRFCRLSFQRVVEEGAVAQVAARPKLFLISTKKGLGRVRAGLWGRILLMADAILQRMSEPWKALIEGRDYGFADVLSGLRYPLAVPVPTGRMPHGKMCWPGCRTRSIIAGSQAQGSVGSSHSKVTLPGWGRAGTGGRFGEGQGPDRVGMVTEKSKTAAASKAADRAGAQQSYEALGEDARMVASVLAHWAPRGFYFDMVMGAARGPDWEMAKNDLTDEIIALLKSGQRLSAAFGALEKASFLSLEPHADGIYRMSALNASVVRELQASEQAGRHAAALLAAIYPKTAFHHGAHTLCLGLTPHVMALYENGQHPDTLSYAVLLKRAGAFRHQTGDSAGGLRLLKTSFEILSDKVELHDPTYAAVLHDRGLARMECGDLLGAAADLEHAVSLHNLSRPMSVALAESLDALGAISLARAKAGESKELILALRSIQSSLGLRLQLPDRTGLAVASSLNNLAAVRETQGRLTAAARLYTAAFHRMKLSPTDDDLRGPAMALNAGVTWMQTGEAGKAEDLLSEALTRYRGTIRSEGRQDLEFAARSLVVCLFARAARNEDPVWRRLKARRLAGEFGLNSDELETEAVRYS